MEWGMLVVFGVVLVIPSAIVLGFDFMFLTSAPEGAGQLGILPVPLVVFCLGIGMVLSGISRIRRRRGEDA